MNTVNVSLKFYNMLLIDHAFADMIRRRYKAEVGDDGGRYKYIEVRATEIPEWKEGGEDDVFQL